MARIPYKEAADAGDEVRPLLESVDANIVKLVAQAETLARPTFDLVATILAKLELPDQLRELLILLVARRVEAPYEWTQHLPIATAAAVTPEQIVALERGRLDAACFDERQKALLDFAVQVLERPRPSDAAFDRLLRSGSSNRQAVEIVIVVGVYQMLAHVMTAFDVDEEPAYDLGEFETAMGSSGAD